MCIWMSNSDILGRNVQVFIFILSFCLGQSISEKGVLNSLSIIVELSLFPFSPVSFFFMYFETLLSVANTLFTMIFPWWIFHHIYKNFGDWKIYLTITFSNNFPILSLPFLFFLDSHCMYVVVPCWTLNLCLFFFKSILAVLQFG